MNDEQIFELAEKIGFQDDSGRWNFTSKKLLDFVFMVQKAEREACAMVAEEWQLGIDDPRYQADCATAIRARGIDGARVGEVGVWGERPPVKTYCGGKPNYTTPEVPCKTHPDAPHGFDRNASHSADRYVCQCEGWEPEEKNT